jgi:hypothetical protein
LGEARDEPKEKPLLAMRVEEGEKFHAEGNGVMFEGKILSVKEAKLELRIEKSRLGTTECNSISATVELGGALSPRSCAFSSIIFIYYFRVKSVNEKKDGSSLPLTAPASLARAQNFSRNSRFRTAPSDKSLDASGGSVKSLPTPLPQVVLTDWSGDA